MHFRPIVDDLLLLWFVIEFGRRIYARQSNDSSADRRSSGTIFILLLICFLVSTIIHSSGIGNWALPIWVSWLGIALLVLGVVFRQYAITVLGRFFSPVIQIQQDHRLVESGPYRYLRHPTYTGLLLAFYGAGLALGNWIILVTFVVLPTIAILRRIRVEEEMLVAHFGKEYEDYKSRTNKLIPFIF